MRGRLDVVEVELADLLDVVEDRGQLAGHPLDLVVAQPQPRELGHVQHLLAIDHEPEFRKRMGSDSSP